MVEKFDGGMCNRFLAIFETSDIDAYMTRPYEWLGINSKAVVK